MCVPVATPRVRLVSNFPRLAVQVGEAGNCLRVEVLRGEGMPRTDVLGRSDPYVVVTAQSEAGLQMFRSKTAWNTLVRPRPHLPWPPSGPLAAAKSPGPLSTWVCGLATRCTLQCTPVLSGGLALERKGSRLVPLHLIHRHGSQLQNRIVHLHGASRAGAQRAVFC